jgi:iron complex transport system ATP-binding protein
MKNVDFVRNQQYILKNINWTVDKNEHWAILGLNGSSKSSIPKLIMAENWKATGDLTVRARFGIDRIPELRAKIGIVGSFIAEQFRPDIIAENLVLTGRYNSSTYHRAFSKTDLDDARSSCIKSGRHP